MTHNHAVCYPGEERDVVIVCLREPAGADTLSAARRNYGMYASRYPLLPPAVPSAPDNRPCPAPHSFCIRSVRPVIPVRLRGREQKIRVGWSSP